VSPAAASLVGGILGLQLTAIVLLAVGLSRMRERLARLEQRVENHTA
jgi:hypothetical protein